MKKLLSTIIVIALIGAVIWYLSNNSNTSSTPGSSTNVASNATTNNGSLNSQDGRSGMINPQNPGDTDDIDLEAEDFRSADEIYTSADQAMAALKKGAVDYDDIILEQFAELGNCSWCEQLYKTVRESMLKDGASEDEVSYYAEVLAISGNTENIKTLVSSIEEMSDTEKGELMAEALELAIADDNAVGFLATKMESGNELVQEAAVAAITNQGSRFAAQSLYDHTLKEGDADGYYSLGIGLGEFIPDEETLPYLHELMQKRDKYSHLAVKSLLNEGMNGFRIVINELNNAEHATFDEQMLEDAIDHVAYEDGIEELIDSMLASSTSPVLKKFLEETKAEFEAADYGDDEEDF